MARRLQMILGMLSGQFVLGIAVNLLGEPKTGFLTGLQTVLLVLHVLLAIGIVVVGYQLFRGARGVEPSIRNKVRLGFGSVIVAFLGGILTVSVHSLADVFSFVMALGFIASMSLFGISSVELARKQD